MTPAEHAKAIEDAAEQYAYAYSIDDFKDRSKAFDVLQDAIWAGVSANKMVAAPDGWQLVPVEPTEDMRLAMATHGVKHLEWAGDVYAAALAAAPKP